MKKIVADTNIFLRFVLDDIKQQAEKSQQLFEDGKAGKVEIIVPQIVIFEIQFTLEKYYNFSKNQIIDQLSNILSADYLSIQDVNMFREALTIYKSRNMDLVDCFLVAFSRISQQELETFDQDLRKLVKANLV